MWFEKSVEWANVDILSFSEVAVIEYTDGPFTSYWVHYGNLFNVIVQSNDVMSGFGAKKYEECVRDAIRQFKVTKTMRKYTKPEFGKLQVIDGGRGQTT